jgi:hypothetical protein
MRHRKLYNFSSFFRNASKIRQRRGPHGPRVKEWGAPARSSLSRKSLWRRGIPGGRTVQVPLQLGRKRKRERERKQNWVSLSEGKHFFGRISCVGNTLWRNLLWWTSFMEESFIEGILYGRIPYGRIPYGRIPYGQIPYGKDSLSKNP